MSHDDSNAHSLSSDGHEFEFGGTRAPLWIRHCVRYISHTYGVSATVSAGWGEIYSQHTVKRLIVNCSILTVMWWEPCGSAVNGT